MSWQNTKFNHLNINVTNWNFTSVAIQPKPTKVREADVIAVKTKDDIWIGKVDKIEKKKISVFWYEYDDEDKDEKYFLSKNYDEIKLNAIIAQLKYWNGGQLPSQILKKLKQIK